MRARKEDDDIPEPTEEVKAVMTKHFGDFKPEFLMEDVLIELP